MITEQTIVTTLDNATAEQLSDLGISWIVDPSLNDYCEAVKALGVTAESHAEDWAWARYRAFRSKTYTNETSQAIFDTMMTTRFRDKLSEKHYNTLMRPWREVFGGPDFENEPAIRVILEQAKSATDAQAKQLKDLWFENDSPECEDAQARADELAGGDFRQWARGVSKKLFPGFMVAAATYDMLLSAHLGGRLSDREHELISRPWREVFGDPDFENEPAPSEGFVDVRYADPVQGARVRWRDQGTGKEFVRNPKGHRIAGAAVDRWMLDSGTSSIRGRVSFVSDELATLVRPIVAAIEEWVTCQLAADFPAAENGAATDGEPDAEDGFKRIRVYPSRRRRGGWMMEHPECSLDSSRSFRFGFFSLKAAHRAAAAHLENHRRENA